jgi:hypothetical protein
MIAALETVCFLVYLNSEGPGSRIISFFPLSMTRQYLWRYPGPKHDTNIEREVARVPRRLIQSLILGTAASEQWRVRCYTIKRRSDATD